MNKYHARFKIDDNAFVDEGDGLLRFTNGLVITDDSRHRNGRMYDIDTLDVSEFEPDVTVDHISSVEKIVAKAVGLRRVGNKYIVDALQYAVNESPLARLVYNLTKSGYSKEFSTETYGPPEDDDGVTRNAKLLRFSQVVGRNNLSAVINSFKDTIEESRKDGLDVTELENIFSSVQINNKEKDVYKTIKNTRDFTVTVTYKNAEGEDTSVDITPGKSVDVPEEQVTGVENQIKSATAPKQDDKKDEDALKNMFDQAFKPLQDKIQELEKNVFDKSVKEPEFVINSRGNGIKMPKNEFAAMDWEERAVNQIESFRRMEKNGDVDAAKTLRAINEVNLEGLKKEGLVKNAITIGDLGNYVISPEQLSEIQGFRSDYSDLVSLFSFRETLSTVTQWLQRSGDINMTAVEFDPASITDSGYLKPLDDYSATLKTMELEELAAVTPVANAATRFLAADILSDVNQGYRTDYQRKLAQLVVARLEQAVDTNGNSETHNTNTDVNTIKDFANLIGSVAEEVPNGRLIMNHKSYWKMVSRAAGAGISGPLAGLVTDGELRTLFGIPVTLVPNDLLPDIDDSATVSHTIEGSGVTINHAVFYVNPTNWVGRTSGGLMYDLSTDAAYESGGTVYSAFQRNQIVLRGSFFRGGQVANTDLVAGILAPGVS